MPEGDNSLPSSADKENAIVPEQVPGQDKPKRGRPKGSTSKAATAAVRKVAGARAGRKVHSSAERARKLQEIGKLLSAGQSVKTATQQHGVSEQTYYLWKRSSPAPAKSDGYLKSLVALEDENRRLKKLLEDRLRKENAELKKKLGL